MEHLHYAVIIIAVVTIIYFQISLFLQNRAKIRSLHNLFMSSDKLSLLQNEEGNIATISKPSPCGSEFSDIIDTINGYLTENKGAASDFHLIKDVVDRNCDSTEEEVATLTPMPLYLGLIGTMLGILVGVGLLVFTGGIDALLSANSANASGGIVELLGGVALAMISSIVGIGLTTYSSSLTKGAKTKLNADKNSFLSWIQIKLLPSLSDNATSAIYTLQSNLSTFNDIFSQNIVGMNEAFTVVGKSHKDQLELMRILENLDITQMARANVQVLKELQQSTGEFERFNQYLHNVSTYIDNVQRLNSGINEHLNRTQAIEQMGEFFKSEIEQIESRKGLINSAAGQIDNTLRSTLNKLEESANEQLKFFIEKSVTLQERFANIVEEQAQEACKYTSQQREKFNAAIEAQALTMQERLKETTVIIEEIKQLRDVKSSMNGVEFAIIEQNKKLDSLIDTLSRTSPYQNSNIPVVNHGDTVKSKDSKWMNVAIITACSIVSLAAILYVGREVSDMFFTKEPKQIVHTSISSNNSDTSDNNIEELLNEIRESNKE